MCNYDTDYLIGKLKPDYEFCPGDWDFLTPHKQPDDDLIKKALETPEYYASLKPRKILKVYPNFLWNDVDSKVLWNFFPFLIEVEHDKYVIDTYKKYSEFKWVKKEELPEYSRRGYFEYVLSKTLDLQKLL